MSTFGQFTYPEITAQAEALQAAWKQLEIQQAWITKYLCNPVHDEIIFIGSGSSYYQSLAMASTCRSWMGKSATAYPSSEIFLFRNQATSAHRNYLLIGVSRSGESTEVILALDSVKQHPNWTIAGITCYKESTMSGLAECLVSPLGEEQSTVMSKSFSSMLFMMQVAIARAAANDAVLGELKKVMEVDGQVVGQSDTFIQSVVQKRAFNKYVYLGMGTFYGLSLEACLKVKEMAYVWTEAYGTLEFRHGPKSIIEPGALVCLLLSEQARSYELKVAEEMQEYGAYIMIITARQGKDTDFADAVIEIGAADVSDDARSVLYLPALQYLGFYTALQKGVDPDYPRNLTQVVKI